jgi:vitamin B12 transporter
VGPPKDLKAEEALGEDAGLAWRAPNGAVDGRVTVFGLNVENEIQYIYPVGYVNLSDTRTAGLEFEGQARLGHGFSLRGAFTYTTGVDGTGPAQMLQIPRDSGSGSLTWAGQAWGRGAGAEIGFRGQDQAQDFYGEVQPYMIAYASGHYDLTSHLSLTGRVENAGNTHYEQAYGYGEPGRMILVGLSWK